MYSASNSLIGAVVQRTDYIFGQVVGPAPALPSGERSYRVVYEDGDEIWLPESELRLCAAVYCRDPQIALPAITTPAPTTQTSTWRGFTCNTAPTVATTTPFWVPHRGCSTMAPLWQWERKSLPQGPMQPQQWPLPYSGQWTGVGALTDSRAAWRYSAVPVKSSSYSAGPVKSSSFGRLVKALFTLMIALLVAFFINKGIDLWEPPSRGSSAVEFDDPSRWTDTPATSTLSLEDAIGSFSLGASWCSANINVASWLTALG